jgi:hypothetical protein
LALSPLTVTARQGVAAALKIVNAALAPIGVTLSQPTRQIAKQSNAVSISPLEIYLSGSSLDRALSTPVFTAFHQIEQALTGTLPNTTSCAQLAGVIHSFQGPFDSIFAVISGGIEGSGGLSIDVGGATANVSPPTNYTDPFAGGSGDNPLATTPSAPPTGTTTAPSTGTGSGPLPNPPAAGTTGQGTTSSGPPPLVAGKTSVICRSLNTATGAHCSFGHAVPVAAVAIALGGGLLAADLVTGRSRRRTRRRARA